MNKQKKKECPPGAPMWMTSYADMVTLILVFFVLMYSFAVLDTAKFADFAASFRRNVDQSLLELSGSRGITDMMGSGIMEFPTPANATVLLDEIEDERERQLEAYTRELMQLFASPFENIFDHYEGAVAGFQDIVVINPDDFSITITLDSQMLFAPGAWELSRESRVSLQQVALIIERAYIEGDSVIVEGHTDNVPVRQGGMVRDNRDLSSMRANSVLRELVTLTGLPGDVFRAVGMSEYHPVDPFADNNLPENRARNRRVVIHIEASPLTDIRQRLGIE
jgi:chemotaxis protein MotB